MRNFVLSLAALSLLSATSLAAGPHHHRHAYQGAYNPLYGGLTNAPSAGYSPAPMHFWSYANPYSGYGGFGFTSPTMSYQYGVSPAQSYFVAPAPYFGGYGFGAGY